MFLKSNRQFIDSYMPRQIEQNTMPIFLYTVFAQSDAAATIYFITQFCAAPIREGHPAIDLK